MYTCERVALCLSLIQMLLKASHKLDDDIKKTQTILAQQDEDITADNPPVIKEYLASADEDKTLLEVGDRSCCG